MKNNKTHKKTNRKPVLVVIYNHYYPDNISKAEHIYGKRFSRIYHLVPFYQSSKDLNYTENRNYNIIPVYDNSMYHQSFVANGFLQFRHKDASHYIFIADDLMLNPKINENNYQKFFSISHKDSFIHQLENMPNAYSLLPWEKTASFERMQEIYARRGKKLRESLTNYLKSVLVITSHKIWIHAVTAYNFQLNTSNLKWPPQLTNHIYAMLRFKKNGLLTEHIDIKKAVRRHRKKIIARHPAIKKTHTLRAILEFWITRKKSYRPYKLDYPLARGAADIFIVSHSNIQNFITHCGIFAAYKLHVEIAIPTSLILTADNIVQVKDIKYKIFNYVHRIASNPIQDKHLTTKQAIQKHWPAKYVCIHPVKLSKLRIDE